MPFSRAVRLAILSGLGMASVVYSAVALAIFHIPWIETQVVYMHRLHLIDGKDLTEPEQFGFAYRQVTSFFIKTTDGESLHAWHVLPIGLYYKNASRLVAQKQGRDQDVRQKLNFQLLREDPEARLVIHTHGASGALAAYCRAECYRALSSTAPTKIHVLAFDYRGFGLSSGSPSEEGLITDAQSVFQWANEEAGIPPERIVVFGQSMGSSVAIALVRELALQKISVAGLIITGSFPDLATMLSEYRTIFGLRAFGFLAKSPWLKAVCTRGMRNKWPNVHRLEDFVRHSAAYHLEIFHARDDPIVPWRLSDVFFERAVKAANDVGMTQDEYEKEKNERRTTIGGGGWYAEWPTSRGMVRQEVPRYGVHDKIMAQPQISLAVLRAFQSKCPSLIMEI